MKLKNIRHTVLFQTLKRTNLKMSKQIPIMHIIESESGDKVIVNDYKNIDKIFLHPEVADRKIVVFTTVGAFRKGKSFLLDYCLRFLYANYRTINSSAPQNASWNWMGTPDEPLKGFSWKTGRKADTKGIIMWSEVFLHDTPTEKLAIVVMDTQGLFENGSTTKENSRIFGLSTLIASIQVMNLHDLVQEDHIEYLAMATSLSQMVLQKLQTEGGSSGDFKMFQKLIFLMRDWRDESLSYGYDGGRLYLEEFLTGANYRSKEAQSVRQHIHQCFDDIQCCLLPHPGPAVSTTNFDGHHGALNPEFVKHLKEYIESILKPSSLVKKSILGREVTGKEFRDFINSYFEAFRSDDIPNVESILEMTIQKQVKSLADECLKIYHQEIKNSPIDFDNENPIEFSDSLDKINAGAKVKAVEKFKAMPKMKGNHKNYETELEIQIDSFFKAWKADNLNNYSRTIELKKHLKKMKLSEAEMKKKLAEILENARLESEENAKARAKAEEEAKQLRELTENLTNQIEDLKKRPKGFFAKLGAAIDNIFG